NCIAKGKTHKPYKYGCKASIATTQQENIIVAAVSFQVNPHDSKTLDATFHQHERMTNTKAKSTHVGKEYRGTKKIGTQIIATDAGKNKSSDEKQKMLAI
ncbi:MAG TPA: IS5/IS1182 family transposase, partial [Bacteroidia bacterium]|nr:IS5/IS1182 family transposase [Bacteroidia bacterium]